MLMVILSANDSRSSWAEDNGNEAACLTIKPSIKAHAGDVDFFVLWAGRCCTNARNGLRTICFQVPEIQRKQGLAYL